MDDEFSPPTTEASVSKQVDYFAFGESAQHTLPDGVSWVSIRVMNEGERRRYQSKTNRNVDIDRESSKVSMLLTPVEDKHALIEVALDGWNLKRNGEDVPFTVGNIRVFLDKTDPKVADEIEAAIREVNPWMLTESLTVEEIDKELEELTKRRRLLLEQEAGKAD